MPEVSLPDDFREQLVNSESGTINDTDGPGVAVYWTSDHSARGRRIARADTAAGRRARADIYVGLILDGFHLYDNISAVNPSIKIQLSVAPTIYCKSEDLDFDPDEDKLISIRVSCAR